MSSTPARTAGWFATIPTGVPPSRAKPTTMLSAKPLCTSRKCPSSTTRRTTSSMSYGRFGAVGDDIEQGLVGPVVGIVADGAAGGSSRLLDGRNPDQLAHGVQARRLGVEA